MMEVIVIVIFVLIVQTILAFQIFGEDMLFSDDKKEALEYLTKIVIFSLFGFPLGLLYLFIVGVNKLIRR